MGEFDIDNHERLRAMQIAVEKAAEVVAGPGADPLDVFPDPSGEDRRADIHWTADIDREQLSALRGIVAEFGPGRAENFGPLEAGLENGSYTAVLEGGQPHKMIAELKIVTETEVRPAEILLTGDNGRSIGERERELGSSLLGTPVTATTEKEMAEAVARNHPEFEPAENDDEIFLGEYTERTIGSISGIPVKIIGMERIYTSASQFYRMNNLDKMMLAGRLGRDVAFVTSSTYEPSNQVFAAQARETTAQGLHTDVDYEVLSYGTHELARVKGGEPVQPTPAQLGAEVFKAAKLLRNL